MKRAGALLVLALLAACNPKPPASVQASVSPTASPSFPSIIVKAAGSKRRRVRFVAQAQNNRREYEMFVASYRSIGPPNNTLLALSEVHITFYAKTGATLVADAPRATADQASNIVELEGGVHAVSSTGMTLTCDTLTYDRATEMVHGMGHVVITSNKGFYATGNRLDSDISLTQTSMR